MSNVVSAYIDHVTYGCVPADANVQLTGLAGSTRDTGGATGSGWNLGGSGKSTVASPGTGGAAAMPSGGLSGWPGVNNYTGTTVSSGSQPAGPASFRVNMGQPVSGITAADFYTRTVAGAPSVDRLVVTPVAPPTSTPVGGNKCVLAPQGGFNPNAPNAL